MTGSRTRHDRGEKEARHFLLTTSTNRFLLEKPRARLRPPASAATTSANATIVSCVGDCTAPSATITNPVNGATVSGSSVTIQASATDNVKVTKVELYIDGGLKTSTTRSSAISYKWSLGKIAAGAHTITVKAYDAAGNMGQKSITVYK